MSKASKRSTEILRLTSIEINNFRCFAKCAFDLAPDVTVFVADNGKGKTAILEAIRYALESFVFAVAPSIEADFIKVSDMHRFFDDSCKIDIAKHTKIQARAVVNDADVTWIRERTSSKRRSGPNHQIRELRIAASNSNDEPESNEFVYPAVALYRANRSAVVTNGEDVGVPLSERSDRLSGYVDCFDPISSFSRFVKWYRAASLNIRERPSAAGGVNLALLLASVNDAVRDALEPTQWNNLQWDYDQDQLTVAHKDGRCLPAAMMSDGVRNTLAIVADIAHRCCRLNPQFHDKARLQTPGVVLIDEIDLHLHPGWQQQIVGLLQTVFPRIQFILTTHSPQVLSTVTNTCIRVIRLSNAIGVTETPALQTMGVESADVLARVMNVDPVPKVEAAQKLSEYRALLQKGTHTSAMGKKLWKVLIDHFGDEHPILEEIEVFRRLQEFKIENNLPL